jgi:hypothetical protein
LLSNGKGIALDANDTSIISPEIDAIAVDDTTNTNTTHASMQRHDLHFSAPTESNFVFRAKCVSTVMYVIWISGTLGGTVARELPPHILKALKIESVTQLADPQQASVLIGQVSELTKHQVMYLMFALGLAWYADTANGLWLYYTVLTLSLGSIPFCAMIDKLNNGIVLTTLAMAMGGSNYICVCITCFGAHIEPSMFRATFSVCGLAIRTWMLVLVLLLTFMFPLMIRPWQLLNARCGGLEAPKAILEQRGSGTPTFAGKEGGGSLPHW